MSYIFSSLNKVLSCIYFIVSEADVSCYVYILLYCKDFKSDFVVKLQTGNILY